VAVIGVPTQSANPPELSTDNSRRADVMESDPVGHAVAFITANDPDGDMLWYKIEGLLCCFFFFGHVFFPLTSDPVSHLLFVFSCSI
jgi:hypothetical protein